MLREAGYDVLHLTAPDFASLQHAARAQAQSADALVVVGGDGMVHLGVNAVGATSVPLAIVPSGSGNDFAEAIGVPPLGDAIRDLPHRLATAPARCDLVRVRHPHGEAFVAGMVSVGFDADVNVRAMRMRGVPARLRYEAALARTIARPRHRDLGIRVDDGDERRLRTLIASVANNRTIGGGIPLVPSASMTDGALSLITADELSRPAFLGLLPKALRGAHEDDVRVHVERCTSVEISGGDDVLACADGELLGRLPVRCEVAPGAVRVFGTPS